MSTDLTDTSPTWTHSDLTGDCVRVEFEFLGYQLEGTLVNSEIVIHDGRIVTLVTVERGSSRYRVDQRDVSPVNIA